VSCGVNSLGFLVHFISSGLNATMHRPDTVTPEPLNFPSDSLSPISSVRFGTVIHSAWFYQFGAMTLLSPHVRCRT
jgi:hypothetical protein